MEIKIRKISNGIQSINRITFTGNILKSVTVDLWDDEIKELEEQIQQWKGDDN